MTDIKLEIQSSRLGSKTKLAEKDTKPARKYDELDLPAKFRLVYDFEDWLDEQTEQGKE